VKLNSTILGMSGRIRVRMLDTRGTCVYRYDSPNTITYTAPLILADLLTQGWTGTAGGATPDHPSDSLRGFASAVPVVSAAARNQIRYMRVGTGTATALRTQVGITAWPHGAQSLAQAEIGGVEFPNNAEIRYTALFDTAQANVPNAGDPITEVSLWTAGDGAGADERLFARQIHAPISKTNQFQLEYTWTILLS
jgi:hypothetical protein